jgi:hypothetical protein
LSGSQLGPFGSGASPLVAVSQYGAAHVFYRGGDYGTYHVHHAENDVPGGTNWTYEIITTPNGNDFSAIPIIDEWGTLHLLASGNDGFGFPPHAYYLKRPVGGIWSSPVLATGSGSGWGGSLFLDPYGGAHITWDETSGNIYTGNLYYATNRGGPWVSTPILADGSTYNGTLVLDASGRGHSLAYHGSTFQTQEIIALHTSGPLTGVSERSPSIPMEARLYQNYPNPFNVMTEIRFSADTRGRATVTVHNLLGQFVANLFDGEVEAGRDYGIPFIIENKSGGIYFCTLQTEGYKAVRKMTYLP